MIEFGGEIEFCFTNLHSGIPIYNIDTGSKEGVRDVFDLIHEHIQEHDLFKKFLCKKECLPSMFELTTKNIYTDFQEFQDTILAGRHTMEKVASKLGLGLHDTQDIPDTRYTTDTIQWINGYTYGNHVLQLLNLLNTNLDKYMSTTGLHIHMSIQNNNKKTLKLWQKANTQLFNDQQNNKEYYLSYGTSHNRYQNWQKVTKTREIRSRLYRDIVHIGGSHERNDGVVINFYRKYFPEFSDSKIIALHHFLKKGQKEGWIDTIPMIAPDISTDEIQTWGNNDDFESYLIKRYTTGKGNITNIDMFLKNPLEVKDHGWISLKKPGKDNRTTEYRMTDAGNEKTLLHSFQCFERKVLLPGYEKQKDMLAIH